MEYVLVEPKEVLEIEPIEGADNIEVARVGGWRCVVKKGQFKPGDEALYFALDCVVPTSDERFSFLPGKSYKKGREEQVCTPWQGASEVLGHRIKTKKLRGVVSQGLLFPMSEFPDWTQLPLFRYEPNMKFDGSGRPAGNFPNCVPKTDQERIQNIFQGRSWGRPARSFVDSNGVEHSIEAIEGIALGEYEVTLKLDGMSGTFLLDPSGVANLDDIPFKMCSRNLTVDPTGDSVFKQIAEERNIEEKLRWLAKQIHTGDIRYGPLAFQGEIMGPGIQGNRENLSRPHYYVYDIYSINIGRYLSPQEREDVMQLLAKSDLRGIGHIPWAGPNLRGRYVITPATTIDELLALADCKSINHPIAEGVVLKKCSAQRFSFKVINNKFLLKEKE